MAGEGGVSLTCTRAGGAASWAGQDALQRRCEWSVGSKEGSDADEDDDIDAVEAMILCQLCRLLAGEEEEAPSK